MTVRTRLLAFVGFVATALGYWLTLYLVPGLGETAAVGLTPLIDGVHWLVFRHVFLYDDVAGAFVHTVIVFGLFQVVDALSSRFSGVSQI